VKVGREWRRGDGCRNGADGWGLGLVEVGIRDGGVFGLQPLPTYVGTDCCPVTPTIPYSALPHTSLPYPTLTSPTLPYG
jgi:hypothetical protein